MPGPVSDSYDPEWSTGENAQLIRDELNRLHAKLSEVLKVPPVFILDLVRERPGETQVLRTATLHDLDLTVFDLRILRFACERAGESI